MRAALHLFADQEAESAVEYPSSRIGSWRGMEVIWKKSLLGGRKKKEKKKKNEDTRTFTVQLRTRIKIAPDTTLRQRGGETFHRYIS